MYSRFCKLLFVSSPSMPWQHGTKQQGWYISETQQKQFPNLTEHFILSHSIDGFSVGEPRIFSREPPLFVVYFPMLKVRLALVGTFFEQLEM